MIYFRITWNIASSFLTPSSINVSTSFLNCINCCEIALFRTVIAAALLADAPTALNSKRLPVNAKGEVRLRSVLSRRISGIFPTSSLSSVFSSGVIFLLVTLISSSSSMAEILFPTNTDIMSGGASLAPSLKELLADTILARSRS